jgi:hypothetical protein
MRVLSVMVLSTVILGLLAVGPASAGGKAGTGCPQAFEGRVTLAQAKALPRTAAGLEAAAFLESDVEEIVTHVDHNANGLICYQEHHGSDQAAEQSGWQYLYNIVDDQAAQR